MESTHAAKVYGAILATPGISARQINKQLGITGKACSATCAAIRSFVKRGAVIALEGEGDRNTKYYKGRAPVSLRQPKGQTQNAIEREFDAVAMRNELVKSKALLESMIKQLDKVIV